MLIGSGWGAAALNFSGFNFTVESGAAAPTVISVNPGAGGTATARTSVVVTFSEPMSAGSISLYAPGAVPVAGSVQFTSGSSTVSFGPSAFLTIGDVYTAVVTGSSTGDVSLTAYSWTFTVVATNAARWFPGLSPSRSRRFR